MQEFEAKLSYVENSRLVSLSYTRVRKEEGGGDSDGKRVVSTAVNLIGQ